MKIIGLLGGTSWPSTVEYYRLLNLAVQEKLGEQHSANLLLKSIDYAEIRSLYTHNWERIALVLQREIEALAACKPHCILLCNNTLHRAVDTFIETMDLPMPFFHMVQLTGAHLQRNKLSRVLLLATRFTMEDGFYGNTLARYGVETVIPGPDDRAKIQAIQSRVAKGENASEFRSYFKELLARQTDVDAAVLACTELPLVIAQADMALPLINPVEIQCAAAIHYAIN